MFRSLTALWVSLLMTLLIGCTFALAHFTDNDSWELAQDRLPLSKNAPPSLGVYHQHREGLRRDLWITQGNRRIHTTHFCKSSDLALKQKGHELLETLKGMTCSLEEGPEGSSYVLQAEQALYDYHRMHLTASPAALFDKEWKLNCGEIAYGYPHIELGKGVRLESCTGTSVTCESATLDQEKEHGSFYCQEGGSLVCVKGFLDNGIPLQLQSESLELWVEQKRLNACLATGALELLYGNEWKILGEQAQFLRDANSPPSELFKGTLEVKAELAHSCEASHIGGSRLSAQSILVETHPERLILQQVKGTLIHAQEGVDAVELDLVADRATWDHALEQLVLEGHVCLASGEERQLHTEGKLTINCSLQNKKLALSRIQCEGPTALIFGEKEKIVCPGACAAELAQRQLIFSAPGNQQVLLTTSQGEVQSHTLTIDFEIANRSFVPRAFEAKGEVCLRKLQEQERVQYALADRLIYWPQSHELKFQAHPHKRVIFFDQQYDIKVSAKAVNVTRNALGKESVKGIGDVRFTLLDQEIAQLRKRFALGNP